MYDKVVQWVDSVLQPLIDSLDKAIDYMNGVTFGSSGFDAICEYLRWVNYFPGEMKAALVASISAATVLVGFYAGMSAYNIYLKIKAGVKWW